MSTAEVLSLSSDSAEETVDLSASLSQLELSGEVVERPQGVGGDDLSGHLSDTADLSTSGLHLGSHFEPALPPDAPTRAAPAPPAPLNPFLAESVGRGGTAGGSALIEEAVERPKEAEEEEEEEVYVDDFDDSDGSLSAPRGPLAARANEARRVEAAQREEAKEKMAVERRAKREASRRAAT